nr:GAF domain-containing protein [Leucobacter weissii]
MFSSGKDPIGLAEAAVTLTARAINAKGAFVYLWEPDLERLVLRAVSEVDTALVLSSVRMRLGEGITGWSGLHRKPVVINRGFKDDPRFLAFDGVDEDYASVLAVPIHEDDVLYGVFAVYSSLEDAYGAEELAIAEEVGLLLASGLRRAGTVSELELQSATARFLIDLPPSSGISLPSAIRECAKRVLDLLDADACVINYVAWISLTSEPIAIAERTSDPEHPKIWLTHSKHAARDAEQRYEQADFDQISSSLGFGISHGVLTCYRARRFSKEEIDRLNILSTQVGVLIENIGVAPNTAAQIMALLASDREDQMLESLNFLGWRGNSFTPVLVQIKRLGADIETFGRTIQETVLASLGSETLIAQSGTLIVLFVQHEQGNGSGGAVERIEQWAARLAERLGLSADIGVGQSTARTNSIRGSLLQARTALAWASFSSTRKAPQIIEYDAIGPVRKLPRLVNELAPEVRALCLRLAPLTAHDQRHGTQMLETLESYALHGGSTTSTAEALFIHRNTLRQRLSRIDDLTDSALNHETHWPEVLLAARLLALETR